MEGSETGGAWVGTGLGREDGGERDGRCGEEDGGERDIVAPQALWGSAEISMGGGSAGPCFAEGRREVNGAVAGRRYGLGCPKCTACLRQTMLR